MGQKRNNYILCSRQPICQHKQQGSAVSQLRKSKLKETVKFFVINEYYNDKANSDKNGAFLEIQKETPTDELEICVTVI